MFIIYQTTASKVNRAYNPLKSTMYNFLKYSFTDETVFHNSLTNVHTINPAEISADNKDYICRATKIFPSDDSNIVRVTCELGINKCLIPVSCFFLKIRLTVTGIKHFLFTPSYIFLRSSLKCFDNYKNYFWISYKDVTVL